MELEEMKNLWQQYDRSLQQNKILNERIISTLLKDKSKNAVRNIINWEYLGVGVCAALLLVFIATAGFAYDASLKACYVISLLIVIASLCFGLYKVYYLSHTDLGNAVTETTQRLQTFRLMIVKERLATMILLPVLMVTMTAVVNFWIYGFSIFDHMSAYLPRLIAGVIVAIAGILIIYRKFYFNTIRQINENLKELRDFIATDR